MSVKPREESMSHIVRLIAALSAFCLFSLPLKAQDRMPPIPADKPTEAQKKAAEVFAEGRGYAVRGPFVPPRSHVARQGHGRLSAFQERSCPAHQRDGD